jgi:hypothetical protein
MTGETKVTVLMSEDDAALFLRFRKFQSAIEMLDKQGMVDMKNGSVTLHYDQFGTIRSVDILRRYNA